MTHEDRLQAEKLAQEGYRLVRDAADRYRRAGNRLVRAQKSLRAADSEHLQASKNLKAAIAAVQPVLLVEPPADPPGAEELPL